MTYKIWVPSAMTVSFVLEDADGKFFTCPHSAAGPRDLTPIPAPNAATLGTWSRGPVHSEKIINARFSGCW